ncbi:MAG: DUF4180 domain-containing protein [Bacteroidota bacterium]
MTAYFEYKPQTADKFDPEAIVAECIEKDHGALLLDSSILPREFFDLSSGVTGALIHRLSLYGIRMAVVIPDTSRYSRPFQDFVREANRGKQSHFVPTREEAVAWLNMDLQDAP